MRASPTVPEPNLDFLLVHLCVRPSGCLQQVPAENRPGVRGMRDRSRNQPREDGGAEWCDAAVKLPSLPSLPHNETLDPHVVPRHRTLERRDPHGRILATYALPYVSGCSSRRLPCGGPVMCLFSCVSRSPFLVPLVTYSCLFGKVKSP